MFETEKKLSMSAALLQQCKGVAAMKVWLNQDMLHPHTQLWWHMAQSGEESFSFSRFSNSLAYMYIC